MKKRLFILCILALATGTLAKAQGRIYAAYKPTVQSIKSDINSINYMHGLSIDYTHSLSLSAQIPLNINCGLGFHYLFHGDLDYKERASNIYLPLRLTYGIQLSKNITISPYAGIYGRYYTHYKITQSRIQRPPLVINAFDQANGSYSRGLIGGQIGLMIDLPNHFSMELSYGYDFNQLFESVSIHTLTFGLGYRF